MVVRTLIATIVGVKHLLRRIGKTFAFMLPVVMLTTGTLAVTRVPWAPPSPQEEQVLAAASADGTIGRTPLHTAGDLVDGTGRALTRQDALRDRALSELRTESPAAALDMVERAMHEHPSLTPYCTRIVRDLGRAAIRKYHGDERRARSFARPVCDGSFLAGVVDGR